MHVFTFTILPSPYLRYSNNSLPSCLISSSFFFLLLQQKFYDSAFTHLLPLCMNHHFSTRIHAQATICKMWRQCKSLGLDNILSKFALVEGCIQFNDGRLVRFYCFFFFPRFFIFSRFMKFYLIAHITEVSHKLSKVSRDQKMSSETKEKVLTCCPISSHL